MIVKDFSKNGLTQLEAEKRLQKYGPNELERKRENPWYKLLFDQFRSPLIYILVIAGIITLILGEWTDSIVIFSAVLVNTILGFFQETKAEKSLIALRKLIVPKAFVLRDGQEQEIEASELVPGDWVVLKTGGKIPADGILMEAADLHVNEAILTGESIPVTKKDKAEVFMGTVVVTGRGKMLVEKTGMKTKMGQIAGGLQETIEEETPLKKKIAAFSKILTLIFSVICLLILVEGLVRGRHFLEMFELSIAVAVASIPESLVVSVTVILTLGMQRLLKQKALVRKLLAAETLGGVTVICADKTGTLTQGKMTVVRSDFVNEALGIKAVVLCNNLISPLEVAMWEWAKQNEKLKMKNEKWTEETLENKRVAEIPFSSRNKFIATLYENELFVSGAPEKILAICNLTANQKKEWLGKLDSYTSSGLRVVSFALKKSQDTNSLRTLFNRLQKVDSKTLASLNLKLDWLGLLAFEDSVREEVKGALAACQKAGIKIKVITGDYKQTAIAVIDKLKMEKLRGEQIIEGYELDKMTDEELSRRVEEVVLFSRTNPEDKIRIVRALKENGEVVAMMGDGVNDALALKKADIGVVVGEASEVAKETADMVLLDSNFNTIVKAVNEGRVIFENIRKVVLFLLSDSFTEVILISSSLIFGTAAPLLAVQILWVNLIEDGLPALALAFETEKDNLMEEPPRRVEESILNKEVKILVFVIGILRDLLLLGLFLLLLSKNMQIERIRTIVFAGLAIDSLLGIFSCKTLRQNLWQQKIFSNSFLNLSVLIGFIMLFVGIYSPFFQKFLHTQPLSLVNWLWIFGLGVINVVGIETVKWLFLRKRKRLF